MAPIGVMSRVGEELDPAVSLLKLAATEIEPSRSEVNQPFLLVDRSFVALHGQPNLAKDQPLSYRL